jgi:hypothetical protein
VQSRSGNPYKVFMWYRAHGTTDGGCCHKSRQELKARWNGGPRTRPCSSTEEESAHRRDFHCSSLFRAFSRRAHLGLTYRVRLLPISRVFEFLDIIDTPSLPFHFIDSLSAFSSSSSVTIAFHSSCFRNPSTQKLPPRMDRLSPKLATSEHRARLACTKDRSSA